MITRSSNNFHHWLQHGRIYKLLAPTPQAPTTPQVIVCGLAFCSRRTVSSATFLDLPSRICGKKWPGWVMHRATTEIAHILYSEFVSLERTLNAWRGVVMVDLHRLEDNESGLILHNVVSPTAAHFSDTKASSQYRNLATHHTRPNAQSWARKALTDRHISRRLSQTQP
jgi:hypothetical protein